MQGSCCFFLSIIILSFFSSLSCALSYAESSFIAGRQLLSLPENGDMRDGYEFTVDVKFHFPNLRLRRAYLALQAWKNALYSDPSNFTGNWEGPNVCDYNNVFCAQAPDDPNITVVAGIDLNHGDIAGYLPVELGLLTDVALLHLNSNRFCGIVPKSFYRLNLLHEFDISNNRFVGPFPKVVIDMPNLKYLDLRFNNFEGQVPPELFDKDLDALFLNDNWLSSNIPENMGNSPVSVMVLANNKFNGCIPSSIGKMANSLDEIILQNNDLSGCLTPEIGLLGNVTVFDASINKFQGSLPKTFSGLQKVEFLDISNNQLTGLVSDIICSLPGLSNFTFRHNFFSGKAKGCEPSSRRNVAFDDTNNCLAEKPSQKSQKQCLPVVSTEVDCSKFKCGKSHGHDQDKETNPPNPKPQPPGQNTNPPPIAKSPPLPNPPSLEHKSPPIPTPQVPTPKPESPKPKPNPPPVHKSPTPKPESPKPKPNPPTVNSPPPPIPFPPPTPDIQSPHPPMQSLAPPPHVQSPPSPHIVFPPHIGAIYASPPPPSFSGY